MKVYGERVHHHHFNWKRSNQTCDRFGEGLVVWQPRIPRPKMSIDRKAPPVLQLLLHVGAHRVRLQSERMAAEIRAIIAVWQFRKMKARPVFSERIACGRGGREIPRSLKFRARHL